jgi:hypothetical protein
MGTDGGQLVEKPGDFKHRHHAIARPIVPPPEHLGLRPR